MGVVGRWYTLLRIREKRAATRRAADSTRPRSSACMMSIGLTVGLQAARSQCHCQVRYAAPWPRRRTRVRVRRAVRRTRASAEGCIVEGQHRGSISRFHGHTCMPHPHSSVFAGLTTTRGHPTAGQTWSNGERPSEVAVCARQGFDRSSADVSHIVRQPWGASRAQGGRHCVSPRDVTSRPCELRA
jgi:hypothetical protein